MYTADRKLWLTEDKERVVEDGDPAAAFLYAKAGTRLSDEDAERYGLTKPTAKAKSEEKAAPKPEDKAMPAPANKGSGVTVKKAR